ncbi:T6SS effector amidase Tae4 family protein [Methylobacterium sp. J-068]|uniref:T6SS effector amidase Tae4 family protein n=1 Tax=Methylobacterium sp. J-068 TaxID=2836649 RepID=UPI001FBA5798|nr:T6SS effector amidase Tae4 family protein [Methylobacterium sp. J-068]MCJ2036721.1 T6SS effector amidase Tae4 family protein [Methylobacterium sp. J-068]
MFRVINADFGTMLKFYMKHDKLTGGPQEIMKGLLAGWEKAVAKAQADGVTAPHKPTSCALQLSNSLNGANLKIPENVDMPKSVGNRRSFQPKTGNGFYVGNVAEIEKFLTDNFGTTDDIKPGTKSADQMKAAIYGRRGILVFRDNGLGFHTELWDGHDIVQRQGISGGMTESSIFKQPRILFWEVTSAQQEAKMPDWVRGWWNVTDNNQYYYHFLGQDVVYYSKTKPANADEIKPHDARLNYGFVEATGTGVKLTWGSQGGSSTVETFQTQGGTQEMSGTSNRYGALKAKKIFR